MKYIDRIANIAVIIAVIVFLGLVVRGKFSAHSLVLPSRPVPSQNLIGKAVALPGVQFPADRNSLVLFLSTNCHFCKDSLPFYRELSEKSRDRLEVLAVLPQPKNDAQQFLGSAGVRTDQIVSASFDELGVQGTPTILLVNSKGEVKNAWLGELDTKGQEDLLAAALQPGK